MITSASYAYTVKRGDTMFKIASSYSLSLRTLFGFNPQIKNPNLIYPVQNVNTSSTTAASAGKTVASVDKSTKQWGSGSTQKSSGSTAPTSTSVVNAPNPSPVTSGNTSTASQAGETRLTAYTTSYAWPDNTPPGSAISNPVIHQQADGTGTYADPITLAVGHSMVNGKDILDYPAGTKFYLPNLRKYFIAEDTCGDGNTPQNGPCHTDRDNPGYVQVDLWAGGVGSGQSSVLTCEDAITGLHALIINPASNYAVIPGAIYSTSCAQQFGDTVLTQ